MVRLPWVKNSGMEPVGMILRKPKKSSSNRGPTAKATLLAKSLFWQNTIHKSCTFCFSINFKFVPNFQLSYILQQKSLHKAKCTYVCQNVVIVVVVVKIYIYFMHIYKCIAEAYSRGGGGAKRVKIFQNFLDNSLHPKEKKGGEQRRKMGKKTGKLEKR